MDRLEDQRSIENEPILSPPVISNSGYTKESAEVKGNSRNDDDTVSGGSVRRRDQKEAASATAAGGAVDQMNMILWIMNTNRKWGVSATTASILLLLLFVLTLFYTKPIDFMALLPLSSYQPTFQQVNIRPPDYPRVPAHPFTCPVNPSSPTQPNMTITCPANYRPSNSNPSPSPTPSQTPNLKPQPTCPDYFRWIHEDMKPWKRNGITREMVEEIEKQPHIKHFRFVIVNGTAYVKQYDRAFQTRDVFTIWGVLQLLKMYPGQIPDVDFIFQCHDQPSIKKSAYKQAENAPPLFHYCGSDDTYDVVFPDWSFWGWPEINIKPWVPLKKDLEQGNKMVNWTDREPYAYWRGNLYTGPRRVLNTCNSTKEWNTVIYQQDWGKEIREGFKNSDMSTQCKHRYKIYMEGNAWSVSEKYILACDSMSLLVNPNFYDFYTRTLIPLKHYWPINPNKICESVKFAVNWGNHNPEKAQEIGREGSRFVQQEVLMQNVYDYMFHVLSEYGKLLAYRPTVPEGAVELCSEKWVCAATGDLERKYKMETLVEDGGVMEPCKLPPPFKGRELRDLSEEKKGNVEKVEKWTRKGSFVGLF